MTPLYLFQFFIFSVCVNIFTLIAYLICQTDKWISKFQRKLQHEYDYIIVGSGTAGSLIAHRIATETNYTFIVLEAGSRSHPLLETPVLSPLLHGSVYDWQFETVTQEKACLAMVDNKCKQTQGKIVGGSAKLNNMIHVRGNISHYVNWFDGKLKEDDIEKQFELLEKQYFYLSIHNYKSELSDAILNAAREVGYLPINKVFEQGFMKPTLTQKDGRRWTTSDNLDISKHVISNTLVEQLLISNKKCIGLKLHKSNEHEVVYAKKGVILAAGAFNSPKILQLSGVGPSRLLKSLKIPVIKDLPVGKNLQDHYGSGLDLVLFNISLSYGPWGMFNPFNIYEYFINGKGFCTSTGVDGIGFVSTKNDSTPDLQFTVLPVGVSSDRGSYLKKCLSIKDNIWDNYFAKLFDKHASSVFFTILHPKSRGDVYIASKDPLQQPIIDPKYLIDKNDVKVLVDGLNLVKMFIETDAMKGLGAHINEIPFPGCEKNVLFSNSYWECYIRHLTLTSYHPVGTCAMGSSTSTDSVVDTSFKVIGIKNLYVADSSVLPTLPSANINAAVAMMASLFFELNIKPAHAMYEGTKNGFCYRSNSFLKKQRNVCDKT